MEERNEIVKYHNDLNSITFHRFGSIDFDLFMSVCSRIADKGTETVEIPFDDLRKISGFNTHLSESDFVKSLDSMNGKQVLSIGRIETRKEITWFTLFREMTIDRENRIIRVIANEKYLYIFNELRKNFTRFELQEFVSLDSKYAKTMYRLLKQFKTTGLLRIGISDFKRLLGVPKSYKNKDITDKIINPSVKTLRKSFDGLEGKTLYERKPGRPVKGYEFTFKPEEIPKQIQKEGGQEKKNQKPNKNAFHNFDQRDYDYDEIERRLLEKQHRAK